MRAHFLFAAVLILTPLAAASQPTMESLWPNPDGLRWDFQFVAADSFSEFPGSPARTVDSPAMMQLAGSVQTAGGPAQVLVAQHEVPAIATTGAAALDPVVQAVWRARPDLRAKIEARYGKPSSTDWWPLLLHPGYFMKSATSVQMWQADWNHPTWTYLRDDLRVGAMFTHQLVPELADNVFLYGTVEAVDATVTTIGGTFDHAVRIGYRIDFGWNTAVDESGPIGRYHPETLGHVHFVPDVGPVEMLQEDFLYKEIDCSPNECPPEWVAHLNRPTQTYALSILRAPVAVQGRTWTSVKTLFR